MASRIFSQKEIKSQIGLAMPDGNPLHKTGAIYNFAAPSNAASKPVGQWNTFEIEVTGQKYSVTLNGEFTGNRLTEDTLESKIMTQIPMFHLRTLG